MSIDYLEAGEVEKLAKDPSVLIVDVRDEERGEDGHIHGSVHFPSSTFADDINILAQEARGKNAVIFHCALSQVRGPRCAKQFARALEGKIDAKIFVLENGFNGWRASGRDICSCPGVKCNCSTVSCKA